MARPQNKCAPGQHAPVQDGLRTRCQKCGCVTPTIGYRFAVAAKQDGQWMFHSPMQPMPWPRGKAQAGTERCGHDHVAPDENCQCGLYAKGSEESLMESYPQDAKNGWITQVKMDGKLHTGRMPGTIRSQYMQVMGIRPPKCENCDEPATHLIQLRPENLSGLPVCKEHRPETISQSENAPIAIPIHDVAKSLSDYYGGAKIVPHGKDWNDDDEPSSDVDDMYEFEKQFKSSRIQRVAG